MVRSFGSYCTFKVDGGYVVRLETLHARPGKPPRRSYTAINAVPVASVDLADIVIDHCLMPKGAMQ
ncbi:hypothetical protein [Asticcacaulis biprosthecium]|nr:hypothetical protein [Asticcacaulis biprosthecium]